VPTAWASEEDPLWSKPCLAYNLHAELEDACREDLAHVQESLQLPGSWALRCPAVSLHVSVATMLSVREDYGTSKDVIWAHWGRRWCDSLAELVAGLQPFRVRFTRLQVSTAAVVALAEPVPEVDEVRARARQLLSSAGLKPGQPSIVHCTLARYGASGQELRAVASSARCVELSAETAVEHLVVSKELVYPNLVSESVAHLQLGTASRVDNQGSPGGPT
jgi:hypothetical protein